MSFFIHELNEWIIEFALQQIGVDCRPLGQVIIATAIYGYKHSLPNQNRQKDRFGMYQIDSDTHKSVWDNYIAADPQLASRIRGMASQHEFLNNPDRELASNLVYSSAIAGLIYLQNGFPLNLTGKLSNTMIADLWMHYYPYNDGNTFLFIETLNEILPIDDVAA